MTKSCELYYELKAKRASIINENASLRFRGLKSLPVPPKPFKPTALFAFNREGDYKGMVRDSDGRWLIGEDEIPTDWNLKEEIVVY